MGNFNTGAAADHFDDAEAMRDREKASDTVGLVENMVAIGFCWSSKYAEKTSGCWSSVNECMLRCSLMSGCRRIIQLMCVEEKREVEIREWIRVA